MNAILSRTSKHQNPACIVSASLVNKTFGSLRFAGKVSGVRFPSRFLAG